MLLATADLSHPLRVRELKPSRVVLTSLCRVTHQQEEGSTLLLFRFMGCRVRLSTVVVCNIIALLYLA